MRAWLLLLLFLTGSAGCATKADEPVLLGYGFECPPSLSCVEVDGGDVVTGSLDGGGIGVIIDRSLTIQDTVIRSDGDGIHLVFIGQCDCRITIRNVTLEGHGAAGTLGGGILIWPGQSRSGHQTATAIHIEDVRIRGFATSINITLGGPTDLVGVDVECVANGIALSGPAKVRGARVAGCAQTGLRLGWGTAEDVIVTDSGIGLHANGPPAPGVLASSGLHIRNATLERNALGLWGNHAVAMQDSRILGNGLASPWLASLGLTRGGVLAAAGTVVGTAFEGNRGLALATTGVLDARDNWWGSALGPTPSLSGRAGSEPTGDAVHPQVMYIPFKQAP